MADIHNPTYHCDIRGSYSFKCPTSNADKYLLWIVSSNNPTEFISKLPNIRYYLIEKTYKGI